MNPRSSRIALAGLHVIAPLLAGGFVYLVLRPEPLVMHAWAHHLGLGERLRGWQQWGGTVAPWLPSFLRYSLPDGLWLYALTVALGIVWLETPGLQGRLWMAAALVVSVGAEAGQAFGHVPGTFDALDVWALLAASVAGMLTCKIYSSPKGKTP